MLLFRLSTGLFVQRMYLERCVASSLSKWEMMQVILHGLTLNKTKKNISRRCFVHRQTHSSSDFEFSVRNVGKRLDEGSRYFRFCCNPASCNNTLALSLCPRTKRTKSIVRLSLCGAHWEFFKPILYVERGAKEWHYYKSVHIIRRGRRLDVHPFHLREPLVG